MKTATQRTPYEVGQTVICAETGKSFVVAQEGNTFNVATRADGRLVSDEGVHLGELRALKDHAEPFGAYISSDGKSITGWKGNILGRVVSSTSVRLTRWSSTHGSKILAVRVRDVHGGEWYGRGSPGVFIRLRPCKA